MQPSVLLKALTAASVLLPALAAVTHAQPCSDVGGLINGDKTITVTSDCTVDATAVIAGDVTIKSGGSGPRTLKRGVGGNLIIIREGATLTLENIVIDGGKNSAYSAGGEGPLVFVENGAALVMNDGAVLQNNIAHTGGAVLVGNGSKFTLTGGEISGNIADIGGGVFMRHGAEFHISGGAISGNTANNFGGGVFVNDAGTFTMAGGAISGNTAGNTGGGVNVWGGTFTLTGGAICNNNAANGDSVFVYESAMFNNEVGVTCGGVGQDAADEGPVYNAVADLTPANTRAAGRLTAGPNPVSKSADKVAFFHQGTQIRSGQLTVYNAAGKAVSKVHINDKTGTGDARRAVGEWNLKDRKGRAVPEGTYVVKGTVVVNGKKEKVSVVLGVR